MKKFLICTLLVLMVNSCYHNTTELKIHRLPDVTYTKVVDKYITSARSTDGLMHEYEVVVFGDGSLSEGAMYHWKYCKYCKERINFAHNQN